MAKISISGTGTEEEKKNGTVTSGKDIPLGDAVTNTDGGGVILPSGSSGSSGSSGTSGGSGNAAHDIVYVGGDNDNYSASSGKTVYSAGTNITSTEEESKPTNEENAQTSLEDLRNEYAERMRKQYDYSAEKLREERDEALRENWVLQQQAEAALPEQMAVAAEKLSGE